MDPERMAIHVRTQRKLEKCLVVFMLLNVSSFLSPLKLVPLLRNVSVNHSSTRWERLSSHDFYDPRIMRSVSSTFLRISMPSETKSCKGGREGRYNGRRKTHIAGNSSPFVVQMQHLRWNSEFNKRKEKSCLSSLNACNKETRADKDRQSY